MKKRFRDRWLVNLALLIAIGGLLTLSLLKEEPAPAPVKTLNDFLPESITELRIQRPGKNEIHFNLSADYWNMLAPYKMRADAYLIRQILSLSALEVSAIIDSEINLHKFGLQQPAVSIQFNEQRIDFGDSQPINRQRYIKLNNKIMLIPDKYMEHLKASSISYIDRHLIPAGAQITSLRIANDSIDIKPPSELTTLWLSTKAHWISLAPPAQNKKGIDVLVDLADNGEAIHFIAEKRQADFVLTNTHSNLEYHLPMAAIESLGLSFPEHTNPEATTSSQTEH